MGGQDIDQYFKLVFQFVAPDGEGQAVPDLRRQSPPTLLLRNRVRRHFVSEATSADRNARVPQGKVPKGSGRDDDPARLAVGGSSATEVVNGRAGERPIGQEGLGRVRADPARI